MKAFIALVSAITFSQSILAASSTSLEDRAYNKIERLNRLADRGKISDLSPRELKNLNSLLKEAIQLIRGRSNPTPPRRGYSVTGSIESQAFNFNTANGSLFMQCSKFLGSQTLRVDDIYISVGGNKIEHINNSSSWWRKSGEVCKIIENKGLQSQPPQAIYKTVEGLVESDNFSFSGYGPGEIFIQCIQQFPDNMKADDIYISVNSGTTEHMRNSASWWKKNVTICSIIANKE